MFPCWHQLFMFHCISIQMMVISFWMKRQKDVSAMQESVDVVTRCIFISSPATTAVWCCLIHVTFTDIFKPKDMAFLWVWCQWQVPIQNIIGILPSFISLTWPSQRKRLYASRANMLDIPAFGKMFVGNTVLPGDTLDLETVHKLYKRPSCFSWSA